MSVEETGIPRDDRGKPDPDEPFRYVCPQCGCQPNRRPAMLNYYCRKCGESFPFDKLEDLKGDITR